jgi:hypothetical protein
MSNSRARFEEWAKEIGLNPVRSSVGGYMQLASSCAFASWSARDAEVESLKEALERYVALDVQADKDEGVSIRCDSGLHRAAVAALRKATNGVNASFNDQ